ncbi:cryptochrome/photolyase family protein [Pseudophaeobacter leonis]|uniref:cryptochrome/photolyase family protein n=1 Tax=Pseudophaeobacter leonis TaxID=1144477 RepID=UPI00111BD36F|nr:cryptochrome/photolyase family protein [Pseudophaeobacter leonis]
MLGDQLSPDIRALKTADRNRDVFLMAEVHREASYVPHHKRKSPSSFFAMRYFAQNLERLGWQ